MEKLTFQKKFSKKLKKKKKNYLIIDLSKKKNFKKDKNFHSISIGQIGKIIKTLKENNCKKVLFAGKVNKPNFSNLKLDIKGIYYIPRIIKASKKGDVAIIKEIINIFKVEKIETLNSLSFTPDLSLKRGVYTKVKPNHDDNVDIKKAIVTLNKLNSYSFTQGLVVRSKKIIALEGNSGTQKMLQNIKTKKKKPNGILVKIPKKKQDLRVDLPTIGLKTLIQCRKAGLKGIAVKSKLNICLEKKKLIKFANNHKMFIASI